MPRRDENTQEFFNRVLDFSLKRIFMNSIFTVFFLCLLSFNAQAQLSDLRVDQLPQSDKSFSDKRVIDTFEGGFNKLLPYVQPSPGQGNAGSCLFMSHTGAIEWWLNKLYQPNSAIKLSERYMMNLSKAGIGEDLMKDWRTDTVYRLNKTGIHYLNESYRFTKDWYRPAPQSQRIPAQPQSAGAFYSELYNWVIELNTLGAADFSLPKFEREVIFADPAANQWNVDIAPVDIVERVKEALRKREAPVLVMYNHMGFWHVSTVFGFNDYASTKGCPFVSAFGPYMRERAQQLTDEALQTDDPKQRRSLLNKARTFQQRGDLVENSFEQSGGCQDKGVFYVRDSLYPDESMPLYDYDLKRSGEEEHLNLPLISREYAWLERLSNHVIQIYVVE